MGVIKEGRVSGTLPNDESFAVHYPGYPKTTARAIQTLGGTQGILKEILYITIIFSYLILSPWKEYTYNFHTFFFLV